MNTAAAENVLNLTAMTEVAPKLGIILMPVNLLKLASISSSAFVNEDAANTFTVLCCAEAPHRKSARSAAASPIRLMRSTYRGSAMPTGLATQWPSTCLYRQDCRIECEMDAATFAACLGDGNRKINGAVKIERRCSVQFA